MKIVVVTYNSGNELIELLDSLRQHVRVPYHVVFWNNRGSLDHVKSYQKTHPELRLYFFESSNVGFATGINRAIEQKVPEEWQELLIINPDAFLLSPIEQKHLQTLHDKDAIFGVEVFDDKEKRHRQLSARSFPSFMTSVANREGILTKLWPSNPWTKKYLQPSLNHTQRTDWVSGCGFLCTKKNWEKLGGYDESYFFGVEDVDLGRKAHALAIPVYFYPEIQICHVGSLSSQRSAKSDFYHHQGMWLYHIKWNGFLGLLSGPFVFLGIAGRFLLRNLTKFLRPKTS